MASEIGVVVGLEAEARLALPLGWTIAIGGGTVDGAQAAAELLVRNGARALIGFGLAGGLDPALRPGTRLIPREILTRGQRFATDQALSDRLGGFSASLMLGASRVIASAAGKRSLFTVTGAVAVDLESGAIARVAAEHRLPFAVLRAICDPAERDLPPAALMALDRHGGIGLARMIGSVLAHPAQLPALLALAGDAAAARRALRQAVDRVRTAAPGG